MMAADRIKELLPTLPLGSSTAPWHIDRKRPFLSPVLMEVLPYLVKGASGTEISRRTKLPITTVACRRARIMDILGVQSVFELAEKVQELRLLPREREK